MAQYDSYIIRFTDTSNTQQLTLRLLHKLSILGLTALHICLKYTLTYTECVYRETENATLWSKN